jgi:hypothetical protein
MIFSWTKSSAMIELHKKCWTAMRYIGDEAAGFWDCDNRCNLKTFSGKTDRAYRDLKRALFRLIQFARSGTPPEAVLLYPATRSTKAGRFACPSGFIRAAMR